MSRMTVKIKATVLWVLFGIILGGFMCRVSIESDILATSSFRVGSHGYVCKDARSLEGVLFREAQVKK